MSTEENLLLDFSELRWLVLSCSECPTEVVIDAGEMKTGVPSQCPGCRKPYENSLREDLGTYRRLYGSARWKVRVRKSPGKTRE